VKFNRMRLMSAVLGASALIAMGAYTAALGTTHAIAGAAVPEHFGGPVNTTIVDPPADIGIPTSSPSNAALATADTLAPTR
jgi:hypothetical protein